jgi:Na+/H+ antiporter NhaD/arsenite permease-like protein
LISNVPATILLSNFSKNWQPLLLGVNIGGLGTLIASLASVISYRFVNMKKPGESKIYLVKFSLYNFSFLAVLTFIQYVLLKLLHHL